MATKKKIVEEKTDVYGIVDCERLNVRNKPSFEGEILMVINKGTKVKIEFDKSTMDFFAVVAMGTHGYCKKDFIKTEV